MRSLLLACTLICCIGAASAQTPSWPERTAGDVEAAYRLIYENHPGVLPELGDVEFQKTLANAHANGLRAAAGVSDFTGYMHVMRVFANAFDDESMEWAPSREMQRYTLTPATPRIGAAGLSIEEKDGSYWIALQALVRFGLRPIPLVVELEAQAPALRASKRVVIDLRGNSGENAVDEGESILMAIYPPEQVARTPRWRVPAGCTADGATRATPANLKAMMAIVENSPPDTGFRKSADSIAAALASGKSFSDPFEAACIPPPNPVNKPAEHGRVIVVTDFGCVDGCLRFVERARALGAVHVGRTTRSANWYINYRKTDLPSGLGSFQTEFGVSFRTRRSLGPFEPTHRFDGDIADTAAVKAWVADLKI